MSAIVRFIAKNATWFYIACAVGGVVLTIIFVRARQSARRALFGLELEVATARHQRALRLMVLVALLAVSIAFISSFVEPNLPAETLAQPTATVDFFASPPPTFSNITPTATATLTATLTVATEEPQLTTPIPAQTGGEEDTEITPSPTPQAPPVIPGSICQITSPAEGSTVGGNVTFIGSANAEDFMFYKLEAYGPETGGVWASLLGEVVSNPVSNSNLGTVNFGGWTPGGYSIRLVIVDSTSNEVGNCYISLNVASP